MSRIRVSIRPVTSHEPIIRALAHFILAVSALLIVFAALFPFDFEFPTTGFWDRVRRDFDSSPEPALLHDKLQNILFFLPLGFGLAASIRPRRGRPRAMTEVIRVVAALVLGAAVSLTVEVLQVFLGFRDPTWMDVLMNTTGSVLGAAVIAAAGDRLLEPVAEGLAKLKRFATLRNVSVVLVLYVLLQFALPFRTLNRGTLENWDVSFPLLVGNEISGGREWAGRVWQVDLASRAATPEEVVQIHMQGHARDALGDGLVGSYETLGDGPFKDATGSLQPLAWTRPRAHDDIPATTSHTSQPARITLDRWLRTTAAVAPAIHRIRQTSQFTLAATVAPDDPYQKGPARIVSISGGTYRRNVSVMHDHHDLSLRLRTPLLGDDGSSPEAILDDVFLDSSPKQIVVIYADPLLVVYVDGSERGRMEITPEAEFIWRLYPRGGWKVRLGAYGFRRYAVVYRLLVLIPFAALLAAATALSGKSARAQLVMIAGAIVVVALGLELILGQLTASGFQPRNLVISILIASVAAALMRVRPGRSAPAHAR